MAWRAVPCRAGALHQCGAPMNVRKSYYCRSWRQHVTIIVKTILAQQLKKIEDLLGLPYSLDLDLDYFLSLSSLEAENFLSKQVRIAYDLKESQIELIEDGLMRELERSFLLQKIDSTWKEHLQSMNALRELSLIHI